MLSPFLKRFPSLLAISLLVSTTTFCVGDNIDDVVEEKISEFGLRGVAITVFDNNVMAEPITRGYGQVSSAESSSAVTPDTAFMIASVSKPFVASAVAVMVDRGMISVDDDVCDVIPENISREACRNPKFPDQEITWRMLMTHRSSMMRSLPWVENEAGDWISPSSGPSNSFYTYFEDWGNPTCPLDGVVDFYRALLTDDPDAETTVGAGVKLENGEDLNWYEVGMSEDGIWDDYAPGEEYQYSNAAYGYLTALIELATDQPFPDFCRENLFGPLGMDTTAWFLEDLPAGTISAVPVEITDNDSFEDIGQYCYIDYGSGSLRTTANDLAKWGDAMLEYGAPTLWSNDTGKQVVDCQDPDCEFGHGWILLSNDYKRKRRRNLESKQRRNRKLESKKRQRRKLDEFDDDDDFDDDFDDDLATLMPSSQISFSDSMEGSMEESIDEDEDDEYDEENEDEDDDDDDEYDDDDHEDDDEDDHKWEEEGIYRYDWTDGIMHDGSDAGVQTNMVILPKAGVYVAVLLNTNDDGYAAEELTEAIMEAISPNFLNGITVEFQMESSAQSWRSMLFSSTLVTAMALLISVFF
eukprot:CAMPEP_0116156520 /NCGR_PEP_ID=MMETSP0329-20121206/22875_1 /TAXON_ID=697910 /ORGANISM="Pseudo-nitzschia arenysensis, Strain B593" /LENGTH=581 /DNA_ID=CAMNT_0003653607 /DNA_START=60 /DNA_END=1805 /DNA_ORIENTATION=-